MCNGGGSGAPVGGNGSERDIVNISSFSCTKGIIIIAATLEQQCYIHRWTPFSIVSPFQSEVPSLH